MNDSTLLVFDGGADAAVLASRCTARSVTLAPLTSRRSLVDLVARAIESPAELVELGGRVDAEFSAMRDALVRWSAEAGMRVVRELLSEHGVSGYWFTLFAEKNPLTSELWLGLAQVAAVERLIDERSPGRVVIDLGSEGLRESIRQLAEARGIATSVVPRRRVRPSEGVKTTAELARIAFRAWRARRRLGKPAAVPAGALIVSYFPSLERRVGDEPYRTRYFGPIETLLREGGVPVAWALLFAPIDGAAYANALSSAEEVVRGGQPAALLEQYADASVLAAVWRSWRGHRASVRRRWDFLREAIAGSVPVASARPLVESLLAKGLMGVRTFQGFVFFEIFRRMFAAPSSPRDCIYVAEFQPWEAALCAARDAAGSGTRLIAYQHTTVPPNLLNYSHDAREAEIPAAEGGRPLPDVIVANGPVGREHLARWSGARVVQGEAIRQMHVRDLAAIRTARPRAVLAAASISRAETLAMVELLARAARDLTGVEVLLKGHPVQPIERLLEEARVSPPASWRVVREPIGDLLGRVRVTIALSTTVGLEALAAGCSVIRPFFPDVLSTSPLDALDGSCRRVTSPAELASAVLDALDREPDDSNRDVALDYWTLDPALPRWRALLGLEPAA